MTPARGFPGTYSWWTLFAATMLSLAVGMTLTFYMADRAVKAERAARIVQQRQAAQQAEDGRRTACLVILAQLAVFTDPTPPTVTGRKAAAAWHDLSVKFRCE